jgi:hypothetical protein
MVPLTAVPSEFAGRVIVAKLGSAGILAELRGVSRIYPSVLGEPHVWVEASEFADARELITTDVEDGLDIDEADTPPSDAISLRRWVLPAVAAVALAVFVWLTFASGPRFGPAHPASTTLVPR